MDDRSFEQQWTFHCIETGEAFWLTGHNNARMFDFILFFSINERWIIVNGPDRVPPFQVVEGSYKIHLGLGNIRNLSGGHSCQKII